ncbi:MAG: SUMF1/EgtB/PvdO family nonheme iron enzyme [Xenococcaceae cyanobacterium MO_234.B1]|nr:SUMF1/EgtB/PvdO family nonheme iron enzyme [Xenococcaceae cyanobacterium MO_234.B1]
MGKNWAIAVGINTYDNLLTLKYAQRDAEAMADWFKNEAKFEQVFLFTKDSPPIRQANPPIPTQPTYARFQRFLDVQFERPLLKPEDNLWFFFAGHGRRYADQDYLMFLDSNPKAVERTAISVEYITQRLRRCGADNVVLLIDACRDEGSRSGSGIGQQEHKGVITFYSCTANQKSWEIDELQHGSFTHTLLEGLRLQGEANCATVERLDQYLRYYVPQLNARYGKPGQNPYLKAEPPYKMHFILLEQSATLKDLEPLKFQASLAENEGNLPLAEQLWIRILTVSRGELNAIAAIQRIAVKKITRPQDSTQESVISTPESATLPRGEEVETSETAIQREEQHQQNLVQYRQSFSQAVKQEFPLSEASRKQLRNLQQSLQLTDEEVSHIEQPIVAQKEAEYRKQQEEERIRQQQEVKRLEREREEAERLRQQQEAEYRQKLQQYKQELIKITEREFPLSESSHRQLRNLQQSLQLTDEDVERIEKPIVDQKEAEYRKQQEEERIRQQQKAEREQRQREEAERLRQQQEAERLRQQQGTSITTPLPITRKQFLKWAGLGGTGLVTEIVAREIFKKQPIADKKQSKDQPKYIPPTERTVEFETVTVDARGEIVKRYSNKQANFFKEDLGNGVTLEMVSIPSSKFLMGTEDEEIERLVKKFDIDWFRREKPQHEVTVQPFFMGKFQVTQAQWKEIASRKDLKVKDDLELNPSNFSGDDRPVEQVSWNDAVEFCQRLWKKTGKEYRLPSEAEWEYACRAGTITPFHFGETITTDLANYNGNYTYASEPKGKYRQQTTSVGSFPPNAFGLYDMDGNVWEWCEDDWHENYQGAPEDGSAWLLGNSSTKVLRGGSWNVNPYFCRSAFRIYSSRGYRFNFVGLRVVCVVPRTT